MPAVEVRSRKSHRGESNPQPPHYECGALPIEATVACVFFDRVTFSKILAHEKECRKRQRPAATALTDFHGANAMTAANSTKTRLPKPYPEFPLFAHNNGQWCRKIRGKIYSFGKWADLIAALKKHNDEYSYLKEGVVPPDSFDGWRVGDLINEHLSIQEDRVTQGEIVERSFESHPLLA